MKPVRNVVLVLLDSLNRHMLGCYGGASFATPNIDRLAARSVRFDQHYVRLAALHAGAARHPLRRAGFPLAALGLGGDLGGRDHLPICAASAWSPNSSATIRICSRPAGENYHVDFNAWDYQRGHEGDAWKTRRDPSWAALPARASFGRGADAL